MDLQFLKRFGRAIVNVRRMLRDRGFLVDCTEDDELAVMGALYKNAVARKISLTEAFVTEYANDSGNRVCVWAFDRNYDAVKCKDRMVSTDQVKTMNDSIRSRDNVEHVVLSPNKLSPQAKKEACDASVFLFDDLLIDLPRHELVPKHSVVTEAYVKKVLGEALRIQDLPVLPTSDAVARWYGFRVGSIVFVDNPMMPTFRIVL
jgi:DNA-directed RNA polymerase subunit H (RpoH/RPB5)